MRAAVVFLLAAFAATGRTDRFRFSPEVSTEKRKEFLNFAITAREHIQVERVKTEENAENAVHREAEEKTQKTLNEFKGDLLAALRSAIARGKPLTCIDCLHKNSVEGIDAITKVPASFQKEVQDLRKAKTEALNLAEIETSYIQLALQALMDESIKSINEAKSGFQSLKNDGLRKLESAKKQLDEIERRIPKPVLLDELLKMKQRVVPKLNEIKQTYNKKLQSCL